MANFVWSFLARVRHEARRKPDPVAVRAMGSDRTFLAYDWGADTFVFEKGVWSLLAREERDPLLIVRKAVLVPGMPGYIMTLTKGNHSVAAMPLLNGMLWNLGRVPQKKRGEILQKEIVCGNIVEDVFELSQRDVATARLVDADAWLQTLGIPIDNIVMAERTEATLAHYRHLGQEWRIRPLAWTRREMDLALRSSRARLATRLQYFHSARGIHFLSYSDFHRLVEWAVVGGVARTGGGARGTALVQHTAGAVLRPPRGRTVRHAPRPGRNLDPTAAGEPAGGDHPSPAEGG